MFSNICRVSLAVIFFLTLGCGLKLGEKNKAVNVLEIKSGSCLDKATGQLKTFFAGDATDEQIGEAVMCLQDVLLAFKDNVRGKDQDVYTPLEISGYIAKKFPSGSALSADLLVEIMKLKVVLVGGTADALTKNEVQALASIIARLKNDVVRLNPHMKLIVSKWTAPTDSEMKEKKFLDAKSEFETFLNKIALLLGSSGRGYELNDLMNLAIEAIKSGNGNAATIKTLTDAKLLIFKFKLTLIGGSELIVGTEWVPFTKTLGETFFQMLRFKYFYDNLNADQVPEKFKVYEQVIADVSNLMQELLTFKKSSAVKNSEIVELFEAARPLLTNLDINAELVGQIGKVKVALLGEREDGQGSLNWSVQDFKNLTAKIPVIMKNAAVLVQNFKHFKVNKEAFRKKEISYADFSKAETVILAAVSEISTLIQGSYDLNELRDLAINLSKTLLKDKLKLPENFSALIEVAKSAKYALTGNPGAVLTVQNIQLMLNVGIHGYANYVELSNFVTVFNLEEKEFAGAFDLFFTKVKTTLGLELKLKLSHVITAEEISQLVLTAQTQKLLNSKFTQKSLDSLFKALLQNILNKPEDRLAKKILPGINSLALQIVSEEMGLWIENQKIISELFANKSEYVKVDLVSELARKAKTVGGSELHKVVSAPGLMNFNEKGFLKILTESNGLYHVKDLNNTNLSRSFSRVVIRAYANDLERVNKLSGVLLEEVQFGYDQLKDFVVSLDLVDPSNTVFISSRFREANLFLAVSNGDSIGSFEEVNHLLLHILSGIQRAESLKTISMEKCLKVSNDIQSKNELGQNCLLDLYYNEENSFAELPGFAKMKTEKDEKGELKLSPEQNKTYYLSLLKAAGYVSNDTLPDDQRTVALGDASLFPHVVQYVEMIYFSHDANKDGYLQKNEAIKAFPIFNEVMKPVQKQFSLEDKDMVGLFIWLLKKGTVFPINNMKKFAKDHECNLNNDSKTCTQDWTINASRIDIGKIFNLIALLTKPPAPTPPPSSPTPAPP